jgi:hypothetical protein
VTAAQKARAGYGPVQPTAHLGLERWQLPCALRSGLTGGPDRARGRWTAADHAMIAAVEGPEAG